MVLLILVLCTVRVSGYDENKIQEINDTVGSDVHSIQIPLINQGNQSKIVARLTEPLLGNKNVELIILFDIGNSTLRGINQDFDNNGEITETVNPSTDAVSEIISAPTQQTPYIQITPSSDILQQQLLENLENGEIKKNVNLSSNDLTQTTMLAPKMQIPYSQINPNSFDILQKQLLEEESNCTVGSTQLRTYHLTPITRPEPNNTTQNSEESAGGYISTISKVFLDLWNNYFEPIKENPQVIDSSSYMQKFYKGVERDVKDRIIQVIKKISDNEENFRSETK